MMLRAKIGQRAPLLAVADWVQGEPVNFDTLSGRVVLVEVFQVNCPGCFLYSLPQAIDLYWRYCEQGLSVLGVATAFEDFDKNTLENLQRLLQNNEVIGETQRMLAEYGQLIDGRLTYRLPFPVAMDRLNKPHCEPGDSEADDFIGSRVAGFAQQPAIVRQQMRRQVRQYLERLVFRAETFELFDLQGTPSHLLVDKCGVLRVSRFGNYAELETHVQALLQED